MTTGQIIILVVVIVALIVAIGAGAALIRRQRLRERFGPEYDRLGAEHGSQTAAAHEPRDRQHRHAGLNLRPLSAPDRTRYAREWADLQTHFLDEPSDAVRAADGLVIRLLREIGYPTEDYGERLATLSVEHARTLNQYRAAHDIFLRNERGEVSTEQLRRALLYYRALFGDLLGDQPVPDRPVPDRAASRTWATIDKEGTDA
jgi:hypothetical protein